MEFKGTKGKWKLVLRTPNIDNYNCVNHSIEVNGSNIVDIWGSDNHISDSYVETTANAQLIAHAPEMLEMLQMWCMDMEERGKAYGDCYNMTKDLITRATTI